MRLRNNEPFKVSLALDLNFYPIGEEVATYLAKALEKWDLHGSIEDSRGVSESVMANGVPRFATRTVWYDGASLRSRKRT